MLAEFAQFCASHRGNHLDLQMNTTFTQNTVFNVWSHTSFQPTFKPFHACSPLHTRCVTSNRAVPVYSAFKQGVGWRWREWGVSRAKGVEEWNWRGGAQGVVDSSSICHVFLSLPYYSGVTLTSIHGLLTRAPPLLTVTLHSGSSIYNVFMHTALTTIRPLSHSTIHTHMHTYCIVHTQNCKQSVSGCTYT